MNNEWGNCALIDPDGKISPGQVFRSEQVGRRLVLNTREGSGGVRSIWMV